VVGDVDMVGVVYSLCVVAWGEVGGYVVLEVDGIFFLARM